MHSKPGHGTEPTLNGREATVQRQYVPALDQRALELIARIKRNHGDVEAVHALASHYESHGDLPSLANLMEGWASTLSDDRKAADAYLHAAWAVANALGDRVRERALYERAVERFPEHPTALLTLEGLLRAAGDDATIEHVLTQASQALIGRLGDPRLRAAIHQRLGQLYERQGADGRAIAQYRAALELDGSSTEVIAAAREIYHRLGKAGAVADMYELEIGATEEPERRSALLLALAMHRRDALADLDGAVLTLRRALKHAPGDLAALERLAAWLCERSQRVGLVDAQADRLRAAELYFQLARNVPRREARQRLLACLELEPAHSRAHAMLAELEAYGAGNRALPPDAHLTQAELEGKVTGRYASEHGAPTALSEPEARTMPGTGAATVPGTGPAPQPLQAQPEADELEAWINDDDIESIDDDVGLERMVPITERPPPPEAPSKRTGSGRSRRWS
jgi:tetratricopeptide (TPR) repeat protein